MKKREVYLKLFMENFIICGLLYLLISFIKDGFEFGLIFILECAILGGFISAIVITSIQGTIHIMYTDSVYLYDRKNKYSTIQQSDFIIDNLTHNKYEKIKEELEKIDDWKIINQCQSLIKINTIGEKIEIKINNIKENQVEVSVVSRPIKGKSITDNGKNLHNVLTVERIFKDIIS